MFKLHEPAGKSTGGAISRKKVPTYISQAYEASFQNVESELWEHHHFCGTKHGLKIIASQRPLEVMRANVNIQVFQIVLQWSSHISNESSHAHVTVCFIAFALISKVSLESLIKYDFCKSLNTKRHLCTDRCCCTSSQRSPSASWLYVNNPVLYIWCTEQNVIYYSKGEDLRLSL